MDDKLPPFHIDSEETVLGACMVSRDALSTILPLLKARDFLRTKHAWLYEAFLTLYGDGGPVNQVSVAQELARRERLEEVGGVSYLSRLIADLTTVVGVEYHAAQVARDAVWRRLISEAGRLAQRAYEGGLDPVAVVGETQRALTEVLGGDPRLGWRLIGDTLAEQAARWEEWVKQPRSSHLSTPTYLPALDDLLLGRGMRHGKLYVVGGQTAMGKSAVIRWILGEQAAHGHTVGLLSLEQDHDEVLEEVLFARANLNQQWLERVGKPLDEGEDGSFWRAQAEVANMNLHVDDEPALTPSKMAAKVTALKVKHPELSVVAMDYLHIFRSESGTQNEERRIAEITEAIRDTCKRLGIAGLLGAQLTKEVDSTEKNPDLRPKLEHFRQSGAVTYLAYCVLGLFRPDYYVERGKLKAPDSSYEEVHGERIYQPTNELEIHVLKQQRGPHGVAKVKFFPGTRRIEAMPFLED